MTVYHLWEVEINCLLTTSRNHCYSQNFVTNLWSSRYLKLRLVASYTQQLCTNSLLSFVEADQMSWILQ